MSDIINLLKKYIDDNDLDIEEIDLKDRNIDEIKADLILFSDYVLLSFNKISETFKLYQEKQIVEFLDENKKHFKELLNLSIEYKEHYDKFGESRSKKKLINYIKDNYFKLNEFLDICLEIFGE